MPNAVAYMRCSGKGQTFGDTWDRQTETILACAQAQGFDLIRDYREEAVPGKLDEEQRPAFQAMIADLLGNGCKTIIVESLDRLAREYRIQESLIIYIASKGLTLISANTGENITEAMMGDPMRRALVQIQGVLAELDKNMIVAKLKKARQRRRDQGVRCEGRKPYGSRPGEEGTLRLIREFAKDGGDAQYIADLLNHRALMTRYGRPWNKGTIYKILNRLTQSAVSPQL